MNDGTPILLVLGAAWAVYGAFMAWGELRVAWAVRRRQRARVRGFPVILERDE